MVASAMGGELHDAATPVWKEGEILWRTSERAREKLKALEELIAKGVDVNEQDAAGRTPLAAALKVYGELPEDVRHEVQLLPVLHALLDAGADPAIADHEGKDARYYMEQAHAPQRISSLLLPANAHLRQLVMQKEPLPPMALVHYDGCAHFRDGGSRFGTVIDSSDSHLREGSEFLYKFTTNQEYDTSAEKEPFRPHCAVSLWGIIIAPKAQEPSKYTHHGEPLLPAEQLLLIKGPLPAPLDRFRAAVAAKAPPVNDIEYFKALHNGNLRTQRHFLAQVSVNQPWDMSGVPLLHDVVHNVSLTKHPEALRALLEADADINAASAPERGGYTPLHTSMLRQPENTAPLLAVGAQPDARDAAGRTPLMHVARGTGFNAARLEAIRQLIAAGADVNATDSAGLTALHYAVTPEPLTAWPHEGSAEEIAQAEQRIAKDICRIVSELLTAGAKVNGAGGSTPLDLLLQGRQEGNSTHSLPRSIGEEVAKILRQAGGAFAQPSPQEPQAEAP